MQRCCGIDHHSGEYTAQQRADLDLVLGFNRRLAEAIEQCRDTAAVTALLDPDPLRYMWVDEGGGRLPEFLARAELALAAAAPLSGHRRLGGKPVHDSGAAARPAVAADPASGRRLYAWIEWEPGVGDRVLARVDGGVAAALDAVAADCFRPAVAFDSDGRGWVSYARRSGDGPGGTAVWAAQHTAGSGWTSPLLVGATGSPSFNQEIVALPGGGVELCWQAPMSGRFGVYARRWRAGAWQPTRAISEPDGGNAWDPAVAALPDGATAYAWCEYHAGSYRIAYRVVAADGTAGPVRALTSGTDYALHPSLAVTPDGAIWCAYDTVTLAGHAGSGPTRLRPAGELAGAPHVPGMRTPGASVPPELLPEVSAAIRVVRIDPAGVSVPAGQLAPNLDTVPGGLPRLVADPGGGLTVAYRVHRRLPLMTYYWEVAAQSLGPAGWLPPVTFSGSDGTLEEPAVAAGPGGVLVAWQSDGRLGRSLAWTEGFGGRECPVLLEHHGEVIWHGLHGTGAISAAELPAPATPAATAPTIPAAAGTLHCDGRQEVRRWAAGRVAERHRVDVDGETLTLYWGDLHRHSLISRCTSGDEPSLEDIYRYAWDVCEYDFWAVTDHSENSTDYQWWSIQKMADLLRVDGQFVPMIGFEWTGLTGHQNVIYGDVPRGAPIFSAYAEGSDNPTGLWAGLARHALPAITIPHHPGSAMVPFDWSHHDPRYVRVVEVFQSCRGNYEDDGVFRQYSDATLPGTFVADGLRRGHRFGLIASSDHGHGASYVGVYAGRLDRAGVFEALYRRRVFAATQRGLVLDVRVAGAFMGSETTASGPVPVDVYARGHGDLARIEILRDGVVAHTVAPEAARPPDWIAVPVRVEWGGAERSTDWSGCLRVRGGAVQRTPYWSPEITAVTADMVSWRAQTRSFGEPYGAQRGGIEVTLSGPPEAVVELDTGPGRLTAPLHALPGTVLDAEVPPPARLRLQPGVGGLLPLGGSERRVSWVDPRPVTAPTWYHVRLYQTDGEMAWSSPVWLDPPAR
jgi:Protein of unknown function (DUF3604)